MTAPTLTGLTNQTFAENTVNATPQIIDSNVTFTDPDNDFTGGTLVVSGLLAEDTVAIQTGLVIYASGGVVYYDADGAGGGAAVAIGTVTGGAGSSLTVTFNASATSAMLELVIESLTYANSSDTPTASRSLSITIIDAAGQSSAASSFTLLAPGSNPFSGIDVGTQSRPAFADLDGDGDLDLVVGAYDGTIHSYLNTAGVFGEVTGGSNPFNGIDVGSYAAPTFVDLDGDTDLDLVIGENNGLLLTYQNNGGVFTQLTGGANPFDGFDNKLSSPAFADIDGDGDMDAVVGNYDGTISVLQNTANVFTLLAGGANPLNGIDVGFGAAPVFVDVDQDGDLDLLVGSSNFATISTFRNDSGVFTQLTGANNPFNGIAVGNNPSPTLFDVDGDGDPDTVMGGINGQLAVYTQVPVTGQSSISINVTAQSEGPTALADNLFGTGGADSISALGGNDSVDGGTGDDFIDGGAGDDTLIGGDGADYLRGGSGSDAMLGGLGNDTYVVTDAGDTADETGGDGTDLVISSQTFTLGAGLENLTLAAPGGAINGTGNSLDNVILGNSFANTLTGLDGADTLTGDGGNDILDGGDGNDSLDGGSQNDQLSGGAGTDTLVGGIGNDTLDGGTGADAMTGGAGNDSYVVDDAGDTVTEAAAGGTDGVSASIGYTLGSNVENLTLTGSADIDGTGNSLKNTLTGNSGANVLHGGGDVDTISGLGGVDSLFGDNGNDVLDAGDGDDFLYGGNGSDRLTGGTGADTFAFTDLDIHRFSAGAGLVEKDTIVDLSFAANDRIDLSGIDANVIAGGDQAFTFAAKFTGVAGQAVLKFSGGITTLSLDVDGDGRADFVVAINGDVTGTTANLYTGGGDVNGGWVL